MSHTFVKLGVAAAVGGLVLLTGGYSLWCYRREINKLLKDFIEWASNKITKLSSLAKEKINDLVVAIKCIVEDTTVQIEKLWNSSNKAQKAELTSVAKKAIAAGVDKAREVIKEEYVARYPNPQGIERVAFCLVESRISQLLDNICGSMTKYLY